MKSRIGAWLAVASAAAACGGCRTAAWRDRAHDFAQVFEVTATFGPGLAAQVRASEALQLGVGSFDGRAAGLVEGRFATMREQRNEVGVSLLHAYDYRRESRDLLDIRQPHFGDPGFSRHPLSWQGEHDRQLADVGLGLHVVCVGLSATLRLGELWDAVAGCFGADPAGDDAFARPLAALRRQALSLDAGARRAAFDALLRRGEETHGYPIWTSREVMPTAQKLAVEAVRHALEADAPQAIPVDPATNDPATSDPATTDTSSGG
ncbi:MAG: hypothetical protein FJ293_16300 [Planctomycetes bacterium]|nr:hypothetical protein [Planctomycetota bacterium]